MIANPAQQYQRTQVMTANQVQLIVLLYDSAVQALELAQDGIRQKNPADKARFLGRGMAIISELASVLDFERGGEIAKSLYRLYEYMLTECTKANLQNNATHLDGPIRCLTTMREAWQTVARQGELAHAG